MLMNPSSEQRLDLIPMVRASHWQMHVQQALRLVGAHDEEVVRSVCLHPVGVKGGRERRRKTLTQFRPEPFSLGAKTDRSRPGLGTMQVTTKRKGNRREFQPIPNNGRRKGKACTKRDVSSRIEICSERSRDP